MLQRHLLLSNSGNTVVDGTGTTGDMTLDISASTGNITASLGNAASGKSIPFQRAPDPMQLPVVPALITSMAVAVPT